MTKLTDAELAELKMYAIRDGKAVPTKVGKMEWLLRYGDEKDVLKNRLYIAHIVSLYIQTKGIDVE